MIYLLVDGDILTELASMELQKSSTAPSAASTKILSFAQVSPDAQSSWLLRYSEPSKVEFSVARRGLTEDEVCEEVSDATIIIATPGSPFLSRNVLESAKNVKLIQFVSVGYDRIDIDAATELGIPVANNAGVNANTVAEHTIMMILALQKKAIQSHNRVMQGLWTEGKSGNMWELRGRTLGILGLGDIGTAVAKIARGFGPRILYNKRNRLTEEAEHELGVEYRSFEDLLMESDVLTVHVPLTDETRHIIGEDQVAMMKDNAIIINTTRRDVVDEHALSKALLAGKLLGVGIDVPKASENRAEELRTLFDGHNAITTSHIASASRQVMGRMMARVGENIHRALSGEEPRYLVTGT